MLALTTEADQAKADAQQAAAKAKARRKGSSPKTSSQVKATTAPVLTLGQGKLPRGGRGKQANNTLSSDGGGKGKSRRKRPRGKKNKGGKAGGGGQ